MTQAKNGSKVKVHYTGKTEEGQIFDTSTDKNPLEFKLGEGTIIEGFEEGLIGMKAGEKKTVKIPPEKAYGPYFKEGITKVPKSQFPPNFKLERGQQFQVKQQDGQDVVVTVVDFAGDSVTIDANHPLAGKVLTFELEVLEVL